MVRCANSIIKHLPICNYAIHDVPALAVWVKYMEASEKIDIAEKS